MTCFFSPQVRYPSSFFFPHLPPPDFFSSFHESRLDEAYDYFSNLFLELRVQATLLLLRAAVGNEPGDRHPSYRIIELSPSL